MTSSQSASILLPTMPCAAPLPEVVLFGFDDWTFPFQYHLQTHLACGQGCHIVLPTGEVGSHDHAISYYGTVIRVGDKLHMWYLGAQPHDFYHTVLCYATSDDGVNWEKPNLGLVEFNGSKENNIVDLPGPCSIAGGVLHDPEEPDSSRRFKMAYEVARDPNYHATFGFSVAYSHDGLRWRPSPDNPVGPSFLEQTGIIRFRGLYYVCAQDATSPGGMDPRRPYVGRRLATLVSADFEHWSPCSALGLDRDPSDLVGPSCADRVNDREEIHLGAGLWNRGNVILGVYGQWHGHPSGDRRLLTMDLGFAISHDALHYREPIPGFKLIAAREQPGSVELFGALEQGQGMENIGDRTLCWYSHWRSRSGPGTGVRVAWWPRDRLGMLKPFRRDGPRAISCPIIVQGGPATVHINASGLGEHGQLRVGLLDEGFRPIAGFSGPHAAVVREDGFHIPVRWQQGHRIPVCPQAVRVDVQFEGVRADDCCLHAVYVGSDANAGA